MTNASVNPNPTPKLTEAILLASAEASVVRWVQSQLILGGYLEAGGADGKVGPKTLGALAKFKADLWLEYPAAIGPSTIAALEEVAEPDQVSDQEVVSLKPSLEAGKKTGKSVVIPVVGTVFANEFIVAGVPLTWGEMTKGLDSRRIPNTPEVVRDIQALAQVFGRVRSRFGSPLGINSGYRPRELGIGAKNSQHIYGRALDISPANGDFKTLLEVIKAEPAIKGIGLGQKRGFLHMDIRPQAKRVTFSY